jgi:hypothetical protein
VAAPPNRPRSASALPRAVPTYRAMGMVRFAELVPDMVLDADVITDQGRPWAPVSSLSWLRMFDGSVPARRVDMSALWLHRRGDGCRGPGDRYAVRRR